MSHFKKMQRVALQLKSEYVLINLGKGDDFVIKKKIMYLGESSDTT